MTRMVITFSAALVIIHKASSVQVIGQKKKKKIYMVPWAHEQISHSRLWESPVPGKQVRMLTVRFLQVLKTCLSHLVQQMYILCTVY